MVLPNQLNSFVLSEVWNRHSVLGNYCWLERELVSLGKMESNVKMVVPKTSAFACSQQDYKVVDYSAQ